mmetsp:Transcript_83558/g.235697  ORF Transcript_83558/g.235697 Transcript_83558/m.235697 type:complete len:253 (-) Transcript_83558:21-779(-)
MLCRSRVSCCHRPRGTKSSRISLLYQRMFGVHGTHFGYKVLFAQAGTIILQSTSRLSLLGAAPLIQDGGYFNGIYWDAKTWFWVFFGVLLVNALYPSVILHAKAITVQRDLALYIDLILDFLYLIVPTYVGQSYDMSTMPVPRDPWSYLGFLGPFVHIYATLKALDTAHDERARGLSTFSEEQTEVKPTETTVGRPSLSSAQRTTMVIESLVVREPMPRKATACFTASMLGLLVLVLSTSCSDRYPFLAGDR